MYINKNVAKRQQDFILWLFGNNLKTEETQ